MTIPTLDDLAIPLPDPKKPDGRLVAYCDLCLALRRAVREFGVADAVRLGEGLLARVAAGKELP